MKRFAICTVLALTFAVPAVFAQNHGEIGVFGDMTRLNHAATNFFGLGGRLSVNVSEHAQLEGEMTYDFERNARTDISVGTVTNRTTSALRLMHGLFGPKFQTGGGALRAFVTLKGGFLNFSVSNDTAAQGAKTAFGNIGSGDTNGVFYPGAGLEAYLGPLGVRLDIGDMMYFDNGANHNLRISFGPHIRF